MKLRLGLITEEVKELTEAIEEKDMTETLDALVSHSKSVDNLDSHLLHLYNLVATADRSDLPYWGRPNCGGVVNFFYC